MRNDNAEIGNAMVIKLDAGITGDIQHLKKVIRRAPKRD